MRGGTKIGRKGRVRLLAALATAAAIGIAVPAVAGFHPKTKLVSKASNGDPATGESRNPSISASGRYVVFEARANNLGGSGSNADVYVHDRKTGKTNVVSKTSAGVPVGNSGVGGLGGAISANGRYVVFDSNSPSLPGNEAGAHYSAYIHDRETGKTKLISKTSAGDPATGGNSLSPTISASGRFVAFESEATNLPGDHTYRNVYVHDRQTGKTILASKTSGSGPATGGQSVGALISPSGRYVGFESNATNLGGDNAYTDVFVHDRRTGKTRLIDRNSAGEPATGNDSYGGWISGSGRLVGFESGATNLPGDHTGLQFNSYVRDIKTGKTKLVSRTSGGDPATGGDSFGASISASGRFVAFASRATNLPGGDTYQDVYLRDRKTGKTRLMSRTSAGAPATGGDSSRPVVSASADFVAFPSEATNLPGDNTFMNVYLRGPLK